MRTRAGLGLKKAGGPWAGSGEGGSLRRTTGLGSLVVGLGWGAPARANEQTRWKSFSSCLSGSPERAIGEGQALQLD